MFLPDGFPCGHVNPGELNVTLPLRIRTTPDADEPGVTITESALLKLSYSRERSNLSFNTFRLTTSSLL
jgi:hypothetical protein